MKMQSLKLFIATLVIGITTVSSAFAGKVLNVTIPFDFQVGRMQMEAGQYKIHVVDTNKLILKNTESKKSVFVVTDYQVGNERSGKLENITFNRYGETYFLREIYSGRVTVGGGLIESKEERNIRKGKIKNNPRLALNKTKSESVSIKIVK
jgi:hypothetical protein